MKGDRFDVAFSKMILPMLGTKDLIGKNGKYLSDEVRKLLRKEHAAVRRMVVKYRQDRMPYDIPRDEHELSINKGHGNACDGILAALGRRAKGGTK